jgi:hypothetical protein
MIRVAVVYLLVCSAFIGILAAFRTPVTPVAVLLPLIVWPDIAILTGLGKFSTRAAWFCRLAGMAAFLWVFIARFVQVP